MTTFSTRLADLRPRALLQGDAAKAVGVTRTTLSKWERGICVPPTDDLVKLLNLYNASDADRLALLASLNPKES
jgi:transcriptional regulator with XRE-family HTH domain